MMEEMTGTTGTTTIILIKKYVIFDCSEIYKINFNEVYETSLDTLRKSIDETKTFIKYDNDMPYSVSLLNTKSQEYTYQEMLIILNTEEWYSSILN